MFYRILQNNKQPIVVLTGCLSELKRSVLYPQNHCNMLMFFYQIKASRGVTADKTTTNQLVVHK